MGAIVLANGSIPDVEQIRHRLAAEKYSMVIAVNGGIRHALALDLHPNVIIGDLDSLDDELQRRLRETGTDIRVSPARKDEIDLELALLYAKEKAADDIIVLGAFGGRIDMTLANVFLLTHPQLASIHVELWHNNQSAWIIRPPGEEIHGNPEDTLSLIPLGEGAYGIRTHHLAYPLSNEALSVGPARGLSNLLTDTTASVEIRSGVLLAIHTPGRA